MPIAKSLSTQPIVLNVQMQVVKLLQLMISKMTDNMVSENVSLLLLQVDVLFQLDVN